MRKNLLKTISILLFILVFMPVFVHAQGIIPCTNDCGYNDLIKLVQNIINWIVRISIPISAAVFAFAGFKYMTTGIVDQKNQAKDMIQKVFIGLIFILASYLIVNTILSALVK